MRDTLAGHSRRLLGLTIGGAIGVMMHAILAACTPQQGDRALAVLTAGHAGCVVVELLQVDGRTESVCLAVEEIREAVRLALTARSARCPASSAPAALPRPSGP